VVASKKYVVLKHLRLTLSLPPLPCEQSVRFWDACFECMRVFWRSSHCFNDVFPCFVTEDIDSSVGRFRNMVAVQVIPTKVIGCWLDYRSFRLLVTVVFVWTEVITATVLLTLHLSVQACHARPQSSPLVLHACLFWRPLGTLSCCSFFAQLPPRFVAAKRFPLFKYGETKKINLPLLEPLLCHIISCPWFTSLRQSALPPDSNLMF